MTITHTLGHWSAEKQKSGWVLIYDGTPNGVKNEDGTTSFSLRFPALIVSDWVSEPETAATEIATQLNVHDELLEALKALHRQALQSELNNPAHEWGNEAINMATAAIAKATGEGQ